MAIISLGGWGHDRGRQAAADRHILLYVLLAFFVPALEPGWLLPFDRAALAIILLIFAAVSGPAWFEPRQGRADGPDARRGILVMLSLILIPVQILLIAFAMARFQQAWNVEVEYTEDDDEEDEREERRPSSARRGNPLRLSAPSWPSRKSSPACRRPTVATAVAF